MKKSSNINDQEKGEKTHAIASVYNAFVFASLQSLF